MHPEQIIGQLLRALVGRRRSRRSGLLGMALGRGRRGGLLSGGTLLTAGGLIWGAIESMRTSTVATRPVPMTGAGTAAPTVGAGPGTPSPPTGPPPPLPVVPPPLPGAATRATADSQYVGTDTMSGDQASASAHLVPLVTLAISAAMADGELSAEERALVSQRATDLGVAADVDRIVRERPPLDQLVSAFTSETQRQAAYAVAYAVMAGDGGVSPGERMYLTQLARLLRLPHEQVQQIERDALAGETAS